MSTWAQCALQESVSPTMHLLSCFHDYCLSIIMVILTFVAGVAIFMVKNLFISDSPIVTMVEVIWTTVPIIILILMAIPSLNILYYMEESEPFLTLKIMGNQWYWSYEVGEIGLEFDSYMLPEAWEGEFRLLEADHRVPLPTNKDIRALVSANDVIHCWTIPSLGVKADAIPGRINQMHMNIMRPSILYGQCSEICGANHSFMPVAIESMNLKKFLQWVNNL